MLKLPIIKRNIFCGRPWRWLELGSNGYHLCCPPWIMAPIGYLPEDPLECWNNEKSQDIRRSILERSFKYCGNCPILKKGEFESGYLCDIMDKPEDITDSYSLQVMKEQSLIAEPPEHLHLSYDRSCNLHCTFCRPGAIRITKGKEYDMFQEFQDVLINGILKTATNVTITGSGDPFGSKHYFELLKAMKAEDCPNMCLTLLTNGLLLTRKNWKAISNINSKVKKVLVSVDAASEEVYKITRPPGKWDVILKNLEFIAELRKSNALEKYVLIFLVQDVNWRDMEGFVKMAERFSVDEVWFRSVQQMGHIPEDELRQRQVFVSGHQDYQEFVTMLNTSDILSQSWVKKGSGLGCLLTRTTIE